MSDSALSRPQYEAFTRAFDPLCPGCLDMNPSIFDWRAVRWAKSYPDLDPQKIVLGAGSQCSTCLVITTAFQSVGLDLRTLDEAQCISLHSKEENGSLFASAELGQVGRLTVELYTVPSEPTRKQHSRYGYS